MQPSFVARKGGRVCWVHGIGGTYPRVSGVAGGAGVVLNVYPFFGRIKFPFPISSADIFFWKSNTAEPGDSGSIDIDCILRDNHGNDILDLTTHGGFSQGVGIMPATQNGTGSTIRAAVKPGFCLFMERNNVAVAPYSVSFRRPVSWIEGILNKTQAIIPGPGPFTFQARFDTYVFGRE